MLTDALTSSRHPSRSELTLHPAGISQSPLSRWLEVLRCPECYGRLTLSGPLENRELVCRKCVAPFPVRHGIAVLIRRERLPAVEKYAQEYEALRLAEGWASAQPGFYEALPVADVTGKHSHEWKLRAASLLQLQRWLRLTFPRARHRGLRILDAGAGCGWMSRELAQQHYVIALDADAGLHGLNAVPVEQRGYLAVQGELENLPLAGGGFDVVVASASAHHAGNLEAFFQQAARLLRLAPAGWLVVMDSPTYSTAASLQAARERSRIYFEKIGFPQMVGFYSGIIDNVFAEQQCFDFKRRRPDLSRKQYALKRLREFLGLPSGARFPMWIGRRRVGPDELAPRGRYRAGVIIRNHDEVLMNAARHQQVEFWHTPGGTMQPGEPPEHAARRRLLNECNLDVEIEGLLGEYLFPAHREWCFVAAPIPSKTRAPCEEFFRSQSQQQSTLQWLPVNRLAEFDIRPVSLKWDLISFLKNRS